MARHNRIKTVTREGFETREDARTVAKTFVSEGGKITSGGQAEDGTWGWVGTLTVCDTSVNVDGDFFCGRCSGTGQFITMNENGKPKGPGGICFRCDGKTFHTQIDRARNIAHDRYYIGQGGY